jgi:hypothetical protein
MVVGTAIVPLDSSKPMRSSPAPASIAIPVIDSKLND